jgi:hypothetical protein
MIKYKRVYFTDKNARNNNNLLEPSTILMYRFLSFPILKIR